MVSDHVNLLTFEDPAAVNLVRRALKLAEAGDLYGASETAGVELAQAATVSEGLRRGMRYSIGAEVDNDPRSRPDVQNIVDAMRPDGLIRSIHFLPIEHPVHGPDWMWPFDNPEFLEFHERVGVEKTWELYRTQVLDAIEKLPGQILGHLYVPAKFGHWPADDTLERFEDEILDAVAEREIAVELNTRLFYREQDRGNLARYRVANLRMLRKAKERDILIAVGADAHSPKDQGSSFNEALALLDEAEINELAFPLNGRLARVALRVTREVLERAAALAATRPAVTNRSGSNASMEDDDDEDGDGDSLDEAEPSTKNSTKADRAGRTPSKGSLTAPAGFETIKPLRQTAQPRSKADESVPPQSDDRTQAEAIEEFETAEVVKVIEAVEELETADVVEALTMLESARIIEKIEATESVVTELRILSVVADEPEIKPTSASERPSRSANGKNEKTTAKPSTKKPTPRKAARKKTPSTKPAKKPASKASPKKKNPPRK
jgi:HisJ family histidinol phosphate phosphatase